MSTWSLYTEMRDFVFKSVLGCIHKCVFEAPNLYALFVCTLYTIFASILYTIFIWCMIIGCLGFFVYSDQG
jgi:hypothetical protein